MSQPASPSGIVADTASSAVVFAARGGGSSPSSDPHRLASTPRRRRPQSPARRTTPRAYPTPPPPPRLCGAFCSLREERRDADGLFAGLVVPRAHAQVLRALSALSLFAAALAAARGHAGLAPVPLAVGATSLLYWAQPDRGSWRRALDIGVVQLGLWYQSARAVRGADNARIYFAILLLGLAAFPLGLLLDARAQRRGVSSWPSTLCHALVHVLGNAANVALYMGAVRPLWGPEDTAV